MSKPSSFADLLTALGTPTDAARSIGSMSPQNVSNARRRDSVHPLHWSRLLRAATEAGLDVSADDLVAWAARGAAGEGEASHSISSPGPTAGGSVSSATTGSPVSFSGDGTPRPRPLPARGRGDGAETQEAAE